MWRCVVVLISLTALLSGCGSDSQAAEEPAPPAVFAFQHQGLAGVTVKRLYQQHALLFAATTDGLYINSGNANWQSAGLQGFDLDDVAVITEQHFIAATSSSELDGKRQHLLFETYNGGADWVEVKHQFGLQGETEAIHALWYDNTKQRLYATGTEALAYSNDMGISWQLLHGDWQGFGQAKSALTYNSANNEIWFGGQGGIENPVLLQVALDDGSAKNHPDLMPAPASIYAVRFAPDNHNSVYVSGEGGVVHSSDNGASWRTVLGDVNHRFYFDVAIDPAKPQRLFTAGWHKKFAEPQPLIIEWSEDAGVSWQQHQYPADASFFGGVRSILLVQEQQRNVLYLGLWKGGIMRVVPN